MSPQSEFPGEKLNEMAIEGISDFLRLKHDILYEFSMGGGYNSRCC